MRILFISAIISPSFTSHEISYQVLGSARRETTRIENHGESSNIHLLHRESNISVMTYISALDFILTDRQHLQLECSLLCQRLSGGRDGVSRTDNFLIYDKV